MNPRFNQPVNSDQRFEQTLRLLEAGDYESALSNFRELASEAQESEAKSTYTLGELHALVRLGRTREARQVLKAARPLFLKSDEAQLRADLIEVQINSVEDKWNRALPSLDRMLRKYVEILHDPQIRDVYEEIQLRRGVRLAFLGRFREASPVLEEVLNFNPSLLSSEFWHELGRCYLATQQYGRAGEAFSKAVSIGLDDVRAANARWEMGVILMRNQAHALALEQLRLAEEHAGAAKIQKKNIYKAMALSLSKLGMENEAMHYARLAGVKL
jgi:tetratricopeptide (TPR) repeat protein